MHTHTHACVHACVHSTCTRTCGHTYTTSHLCSLDVTAHLVELVHLQLQQRESKDMSFRNKACSEATGGCLIDVDWISQNTPC